MSRSDRRAVGASLAALGLEVGGIAAAGDPWAPARAVAAARFSAWVAVVALLLALTVTPAQRALPPLRGWRRPLGIAAAVAASGHSTIALLGALRGALGAVWTWPYLRAGATALALLLVLLVTSLPTAPRRVRQWKVLHRAVYGVGVLAALHAFGAPRASAAGALSIAAAVGLLLAARLPRAFRRSRGSGRRRRRTR